MEGCMADRGPFPVYNSLRQVSSLKVPRSVFTQRAYLPQVCLYSVLIIVWRLCGGPCYINVLRLRQGPHAAGLRHGEPLRGRPPFRLQRGMPGAQATRRPTRSGSAIGGPQGAHTACPSQGLAASPLAGSDGCPGRRGRPLCDVGHAGGQPNPGTNPS